MSSFQEQYPAIYKLSTMTNMANYRDFLSFFKSLPAIDLQAIESHLNNVIHILDKIPFTKNRMELNSLKSKKTEFINEPYQLVLFHENDLIGLSIIYNEKYGLSELLEYRRYYEYLKMVKDYPHIIDKLGTQFDIPSKEDMNVWYHYVCKFNDFNPTNINIYDKYQFDNNAILFLFPVNQGLTSTPTPAPYKAKATHDLKERCFIFNKMALFFVEYSLYQRYSVNSQTYNQVDYIKQELNGIFFGRSKAKAKEYQFYFCDALLSFNQNQIPSFSDDNFFNDLTFSKHHDVERPSTWHFKCSNKQYILNLLKQKHDKPFYLNKAFTDFIYNSNIDLSFNLSIKTEYDENLNSMIVVGYEIIDNQESETGNKYILASDCLIDSPSIITEQSILDCMLRNLYHQPETINFLKKTAIELCQTNGFTELSFSSSLMIKLIKEYGEENALNEIFGYFSDYFKFDICYKSLDLNYLNLESEKDKLMIYDEFINNQRLGLPYFTELKLEESKSNQIHNHKPQGSQGPQGSKLIIKLYYQYSDVIF